MKPLLQRALASKGMQLSPDEIDALYEDYVKLYAAHIADPRPFPGLDAALDALAEDGCILAVCTNKLEWLSVLLLDKLGLSPRFAAICGAGHVCDAQARSRDAAPHHRPGPAAMSAQRRDGRRLMTDVATAKGGAHPGRGGGLRLHRNRRRQLGADRLISHFDALKCGG